MICGFVGCGRYIISWLLWYQWCSESVYHQNCSLYAIWLFLINVFLTFGRYKEGHAVRHWKDTQHCYSLDLETQRVWDYVGDSYVHRLNQSKSDDKLVKLKSNCRSMGDNCVSCTCSDDSGISGTLLCSKVEVVRFACFYLSFLLHNEYFILKLE